MKDQLSYFDSILLKLESDDALWQVRDPVSGFAIWPFARHKVLFHLMYSKRNIQSFESVHASTGLEKARSIFFSLFKGNPYRIQRDRHRVLIFNSGVSNVKEGHYFFNRLADFFFKASPENTVLIEETAYGKHALPRPGHVYSHLFIRLAAVLIQLIQPKKSQRLSESIHAIKTLINQKLGDDACDANFMATLETDLKIKLYKVRAEAVVYRHFLMKKKPELILVEDACYGSRAHLISIARSLSIRVAEYQHGFINRFHLAYNFGPAILKDTKHIAYFPDVLLTYGEYWGKVIRVPVQKINIGNPYLSEYKGKIKSRPKTILLLGSGVNVESTIEKILSIHSLVERAGFVVVFRPHPLEWPNASQTYKPLLDRSIQLDIFSNLYESIQSSEIVAGEVSTALYEAKMFTNKVYLIRSSFVELFGDDVEKIFPWIEQGIENNFAVVEDEKSSFWEDEWKEKYLRFVKSISLKNTQL